MAKAVIISLMTLIPLLCNPWFSPVTTVAAPPPAITVTLTTINVVAGRAADEHDSDYALVGAKVDGNQGYTEYRYMGVLEPDNTYTADLTVPDRDFVPHQDVVINYMIVLREGPYDPNFLDKLADADLVGLQPGNTAADVQSSLNGLPGINDGCNGLVLYDTVIIPTDQLKINQPITQSRDYFGPPPPSDGCFYTGPFGTHQRNNEGHHYIVSWTLTMHPVE